MTEQINEDFFPLRVGDGAVLYVSASRLKSPSTAEVEIEVSGRIPSTRQIIEVIGQFANELTNELRKSGAARFTVEFGCDIAVETGQVFAVLGKASTKSSLKVTLEWDRPQQ